MQLDLGSTFWDNLADNITLDDGHSHNGVNSAALTTSGFTTGSSAVTGASWTADGDWYYKTITMPGSYTWAGAQMRFIENVSKAEIHPRLVYVSANSFKLYMPVNNLAIDILYT